MQVLAESGPEKAAMLESAMTAMSRSIGITN